MTITAHDAARTLLDRGVNLASWLTIAVAEKVITGNGVVIGASPLAQFDNPEIRFHSLSSNTNIRNLLLHHAGDYVGDDVVVWMLGKARCGCGNHEHDTDLHPVLTVFVVNPDFVDVASIDVTNRIIVHNDLENGDDLIAPLLQLVCGDLTTPPHIGEDGEPTG